MGLFVLFGFDVVGFTMAVLNQGVQTLHLLILGSVVDRTLSVFVERKLCTVTQQPPDSRQMSPGGSKVKRGGTITVTKIRIDTLILDLHENRYETNWF